MKTTLQKPRTRYFTDGEYVWKSSGAGVHVRRDGADRWNQSCFKGSAALLKAENLTEITARKGEIP